MRHSSLRLENIFIRFQLIFRLTLNKPTNLFKFVNHISNNKSQSMFFLQSNAVTDTIANAGVSVASATTSTESISYLSFILKGGALIIPIILLLFFCIYVIVEKYLSIQKIIKQDRKSTRLNSSHERRSRMPSSA